MPVVIWTNFKLFGKLQTLFKEKLLFWLEALGLTSNMGLASPAFSTLNAWLASSQGVSIIVDWRVAND